MSALSVSGTLLGSQGTKGNKVSSSLASRKFPEQQKPFNQIVLFFHLLFESGYFHSFPLLDFSLLNRFKHLLRSK